MLVTPINETSVNSDEDDIASGSQFIDLGTGIRFDFGDFTFHANGGGGNDDRFTIDDNSESINGFGFTIDQISNGTVIDINIRAVDADNDGGLQEQNVDQTAFVDTDATDPITQIKIYDSSDPHVLIGTFNGDGSVNGITVDFLADGTVDIENLPSDYRIVTYTAGQGYNRIEINNTGTASPDGKFSVSELSIETVATGNDNNHNYHLQDTARDGDTVAVPGGIDITLQPAGSLETLSSLASTSSLAESSFDTSSLFANDNQTNQKLFHNGSNAVLMGALAAAGIESAPAAAATADGQDTNVLDSGTSATASVYSVSSVSDDGPASSSGTESQLLGDTGSKDDGAPDHGPQSHDDNGKGNDGGVSNETADAEAPADLPQGTEAPAQEAGSTSVTAAAIVMPSAADLAGTSEGGHAQHNEVVGKVLADALHGGGGESSNVETLINSLGHDGSGGQGNAALEALASHGGADVSNGDIGIFASFSSGQGMHMMEMHQDAAPAHA
jgi:hypothetical protein